MWATSGRRHHEECVPIMEEPIEYGVGHVPRLKVRRCKAATLLITLPVATGVDHEHTLVLQYCTRFPSPTPCSYDTTPVPRCEQACTSRHVVSSCTVERQKCRCSRLVPVPSSLERWTKSRFLQQHMTTVRRISQTFVSGSFV